MDPNGHIYRAPEDEIPEEDMERLDNMYKSLRKALSDADVDKIREAIEAQDD